MKYLLIFLLAFEAHAGTRLRAKNMARHLKREINNRGTLKKTKALRELQVEGFKLKGFRLRIRPSIRVKIPFVDVSIAPYVELHYAPRTPK